MPFGVTFGTREKGLAEAIVAEMIAQGVGGGGGGGSGLTQAQVQAAIESASNLEQLELLIGTRLPALSNNRIPVDINSLGFQGLITAAIDNSLDIAEIITNTAQIGVRGEAPASTDISFAGIIGLLKRLLVVKLPDAIAGRIQTENRLYRPDIVTTPPLESILSISDTATTKAALLSRTRIAISNTGANPVYIDVTGSITTTKYLFLLQSNELYTDDFHAGIYFFRCATGLTSTIQVREWQ